MAHSRPRAGVGSERQLTRGSRPDLSGERRTDLAILERIVAREPQAVADLYHLHQRLLLKLIRRILNNRAESEEVLQDVFLRVWTRADTYDALAGSPVAWLVGIARHRAIDRLRENNVRAFAITVAPPAAADPETSAALSQQQRVVVDALGTLPPGQRLLIERAFYLGLTHPELARQFHLPLGTVKTRIRAGLRALRASLVEEAGPLSTA